MENAKIKSPVNVATPARRPRRVAGTLYTADEIHEIFRRFSILRPEPKGELEHVNAFTLLVAVVLSAQATDAGVNKATRALFAIADTPQKMLALGEEAVGNYIRTIGLWRNKAKNVILLSEALIREHGGEVPDDFTYRQSHGACTRKNAGGCGSHSDAGDPKGISVPRASLAHSAWALYVQSA